MGDGEAYHRSVGQVDRTLDEAFAEGAATHDDAAVVILYGTRYNLCRRGRIAVDEDDDLSLSKQASAFGMMFHALGGASFGIDHQVALLQELIGNLHGSMQIAAAILLQVEHQCLHALRQEGLQTLHEFVVRGGSEVADADIAHFRTKHIGGVDGVDRNLVADNLEVQGVANALSHDAEVDLRPLGTAQSAHNLFARHLDAGNGGVVDVDDAVASQDTSLLGRSVGDGLDDKQRVFHHVELYADALERPLQGFVHLLHLLGGGVRRVGVQLLYHAADAVFYQLLLVDAVDIEVGNGQFGHLQLA